MTDTPNARLARVLRLLADVAERGPLSESGHQAIGAMWDAHIWEDDSLDSAERLATEAARLAGVPLDGWYTSEPPKDVQVLVADVDSYQHVAEWTGYHWHYNASCIWKDEDIIAWRPLPEPYRPEEVPHA